MAFDFAVDMNGLASRCFLILRTTVLGFLFVVCFYKPLVAGGFILPSTGGKAQGMAGAWVAQGDDLSVMDYNPALLTQHRKYAIEVDYSLVTGKTTFDQAFVPNVGDSGPSYSLSNPKHVPNLYANFPIKTKGNIGLAVYSPLGTPAKYESFGPQRYQLISSSQLLIYLGLVGAYQPIKNLSVAAAVEFIYVQLTQVQALTLLTGFSVLDGTLEIKARSNKPLVRAKLGIAWNFKKNFYLGASYASGFDIKVAGKIGVTIPSVGFTPEDANDKIVATQRSPNQLRFGLGYKRKPWRAEVALSYARWNEYRAQVVDLAANDIGGFPIADLQNTKVYRDNYTIHVGAGYAITDRQEVLWGYAFDSQANQNPTVSVSDFDAPKHFVGLGYAFRLNHFYMSLAYNLVYYQKINVVDSKAKPIAILGEIPPFNDGTYQRILHILGSDVGVTF